MLKLFKKGRAIDSFQCIDSSEIILPLYYKKKLDISTENRPMFLQELRNMILISPLLAALHHPKELAPVNNLLTSSVRSLQGNLKASI